MPLTPDPYETAPDAGQGIEGNQDRPNSHEGTDLMTNPTAIADALATIIALLNAFNREKLKQVTAGWTAPQRYAYASQMLELQHAAGRKAQAVAAVAEAAHPVTEQDRPAGHTGPLEPFTTVLAETGQPLREWAIDFDSPEDTNVWIRRDDTLAVDGRHVVIGTPTVNVELESAGTQQFNAHDAESLALAILSAAVLLRTQEAEANGWT
ncbi:hypothetical protein BH93_02310 [Rhodococcoides fascians A25f]|uniref:hypothetical protein n=1 Tax=Rhodococcoides fascians TaxID=1828 RepID=UPI000564B285|nr:hypothetical protein [Rhodococcus fascians]QII04348.1 hypothetical protein BH93_02310 [Rhodococcus fascians A25f]